MTADNKILGEIHQQLAATYKRLISPREEPVFDKEGQPVLIDGEPVTRVVYPTAAELAAANAFLKQNNITSKPEDSDDLKELRDQLSQRRRRAPPVLPDFGDGFGGMQ